MTMKNLIIGALAIFISITAFADDQEIPTISSSCQIRSLPGGRDGSTVQYSWKITAKSTEDRVLSIEQLTRNEQPSPFPDLRGY